MIGFLAFYVAADLLWADVVIFTNGSKMEGEVTEENGQKVTIAMEGGSITVQRSEVASITRTQAVSPPETLQSYKQKLQPLMEEWTALVGDVARSSARLGQGDLISSWEVDVLVGVFREYEARCVTFRRKLEKISPPTELTQFHSVLLEAVENQEKACHWFLLATQDKLNDALYSKAAEYQEESTRFASEASAVLWEITGEPNYDLVESLTEDDLGAIEEEMVRDAAAGRFYDDGYYVKKHLELRKRNK